MDTIKTSTQELMVRDVMNSPQELLDFTVYGIGIAQAAAIFSDAAETQTLIVTIDSKQYTYSGYTNLGMIRQRERGGVEIGLTKWGV